MDLKRDGQDSDQRNYANLLAVLTNVGLSALVALFLFYVIGLFDPHVPHEALPTLWSLSAREFLEATRIAPGWGWVEHAHRGDVLTLFGIVALACASIPCLVAAMMRYRRMNHSALFVICALEILVILLSASGLVAGS